jgi:hypothetical protein
MTCCLQEKSDPVGLNFWHPCPEYGPTKNLRPPPRGDVLGPWVRVCFTGGESPITVGNHSLPSDPHKAAIQSFEFGHSDGLTVRVVIQDQYGGAFKDFMEHLFKDWKCGHKSAKYTMNFQFGWVKSSCKHPHPDVISPCYYAIVDSLETSFTEGKFICEVTGKDFGDRMFEGMSEELEGGDGDKGECLKDAITNLMTASKEAPTVAEVAFRRRINKDTDVEAGFLYCDPNCDCEVAKRKQVPKNEKGENANRGPRLKWPVQGQDKLQATLRWLKKWITNNKKSWLPSNNPSVAGGKITYWEDRTPLCVAKDDGYWFPNSVGTFIVNGGKYSPVIEFNPKIRWDFSRFGSGGGGTTSSNVKSIPEDPNAGNEGSHTKGRRECKDLNRKAQPGAGHAYNIAEDEGMKNYFGDYGDMYDAAVQESLRVHGDLLHDAIEADMVLVGDPTLVPLEAMRLLNCHVIFINPYFIEGGGLQKGGHQTKCGDWTVREPCNEVLTNMAWMIQSVTHKIELGNYTTTLGLLLAVPGKHGNIGEPLGLWDKGWVPPSGC